jgi:hypothetical protein
MIFKESFGLTAISSMKKAEKIGLVLIRSLGEKVFFAPLKTHHAELAAL